MAITVRHNKRLSEPELEIVLAPVVGLGELPKHNPAESIKAEPIKPLEKETK